MKLYHAALAFCQTLLLLSVNCSAVSVASVSNGKGHASHRAARWREISRLIGANSSAAETFDASKLKSRLLRATDLMERGLTDANGAADSAQAIKHVAKDFSRLKNLWTRLEEQHDAEIDALRAEVDRQKSAREEAEKLSDLREKDHAHMETVMKAEMDSAHKCAAELKTVKAASCKTVCSTCLSMRHNDSIQIATLTHEKHVVQTALNDLQKGCAAKASSTQVAISTNSTKQALLGNKTVVSYVEKIEELEAKDADLQSKEEDVEDDKDALASMVQEMHATNEKLQADNVAQQKLIAKLQRQVEVLSTDKGQLLDSFRAIIHDGGQNDQDATLVLPAEKPEDMQLGNNKFDDIAWMGKTAGIDKYIHAMYAPIPVKATPSTHTARSTTHAKPVARQPLDRFLSKEHAHETSAPILRATRKEDVHLRSSNPPRPSEDSEDVHHLASKTSEVEALAAADTAAADYSSLAKASMPGKTPEASANAVPTQKKTPPASHSSGEPSAVASVSDLEQASHLLDGME